MKVILSRKGFDSSYGGIPSPILPDGTLMTLPIPSQNDKTTLADANYYSIDNNIIPDLSHGKWSLDSYVHLDPDLDRPLNQRIDGWRPALGQTGAAQAHLANNGIGPGDVFLFFGWFKRAENKKGIWRYVRGAPDLHVIFGWLEIEKALPIVTHRQTTLKGYPWIANHPHVADPNWYNNTLNTLYIAREKSEFTTIPPHGGGRFTFYKPSLQLTKNGCSRSVWSLPRWFEPTKDKKALSYHGDQKRWSIEGDQVTLKTAAKGQEFVIDGSEYPEIESWAASIIREGINEAM
jgi:hypothetical protein